MTNGLRSVLIVLLLSGARVEAQAFTPEKGLFSLTTLYQLVENTGHRMSDGFMLRDGQSTSMGALVEGEYGLSDRLAVSLSLPYIMARYHGVGPTPANLPVDSCRCWHKGLADFSGAARYRFGGDTLALTPTLGVTIPSHAYNYQGEAVLGRRLKELRLGATVATRPDFLKDMVVSLSYSYAVVEKAKVTIPNNRSNLAFDLSRSLGERWSLRASAAWQRTHGGLLFGTLNPAVPDTSPLHSPGEVGRSKLFFDEHDRLLRDNHWRVGSGIGYALDKVDLFTALSIYVSGTDAHDGYSLTIGATWYFGGNSSLR